MTTEEINQYEEKFRAMSQSEMASLWRFSKPGHPYFQGEVGELFRKIFFNEKGGFNPSISKAIDQ